MLGQMAPIMGTAHPLVAEALRASRVRKFSGQAEDFEEFEREWNFHLKIMHGAAPGMLPDPVVLMNLKNFLDEASAALLQGKMALDPDLSYYAFWDELKSKFLRDARNVHRRNWRGVKLNPAGSTATLQEWLRFQAIYTAKRGLVEDWSDAEDQQHVFSQVPPHLQIKVLAETQKRRTGKMWVRVVLPPGLRMAEVVENLETEIGTRVNVISQDRRHFVIACNNQVEMAALLDLDGSQLDGGVLRVQRAEYSMTGDDMFQYVKQLLETDDELVSLRRAYEIKVPSPRVNAVQADPRPSSPKDSKATVPKWTGKSSYNRNSDNKYQSKGGKWTETNWRDQAAPASAPESPYKKKGGYDRNTCYTCHRAGRDANHDYKSCPHVKSWSAKRDQPANNDKKTEKGVPAKAASSNSGPPTKSE